MLHRTRTFATRIVRPLVGGLVCAFLASCSDSGDPVKPKTPPGPPSFSADIQPIFNSRCAVSGCHVQPAPTASCDLSAGASYANIVGVATTVFVPGVRVTPGDAGASVLYLLVKSGQMPARGGPLTPAQVTAIKTWIEEGAADN